MKHFMPTPANNRSRLLVFSKDNICLYDSKRGDLIEVSPLLARVLRLIGNNTSAQEIFDTLELSNEQRYQVKAQLRKLVKLGFLAQSAERADFSSVRVEIDETQCVFPPVKALIFHVTHSCNLRCIHCYIDAEEGDREKSNFTLGEELTLAEIRSVLEDFSKMGGLSVDITGGEPLSRKDIFQILATARRLRIHVRLLSNGVLLKDQKLATRVSRSADEIIISLDGLRETHNWIRNGDYFDTVVEASRFLVSCGCRVGITTLLTYKSLYELPKIANLLADIGVEKWNLNLPRPIGRAVIGRNLAADTLREYFANSEKTVSILKEAYDAATRGNVAVMGELSMFPKKIRDAVDRNKDSFYGLYEQGRACCNANLCVFSNGDVVPCLFYPELVYGNVKETPLNKLHSGSPRHALLEVLSKRPPNAVCPALVASEKRTAELQRALEGSLSSQ